MGTPDGQIFNGETATPMPGGHDYIHLAAETVNPSNGSVTIKFNLPMPKGRGITLPFAPTYNSAGLYRVGVSPTSEVVTILENDRTVGGTYPWASWSKSSFTVPPPTCNPECGLPASYGPCLMANGFSFTDQYGTSHNLGLGVLANAVGYSPTSYCPPAGGAGYPGFPGYAVPPPGTGDGQVWAMWQSPSQTVADVGGFPTNGTVGPFTVTDKEGTTFFFGGGGSFDPALQLYSATPDRIEDRNGNVITSNIDTLGRQITTGTTIGGLTYPAGTCPNCPDTTPVNYTEVNPTNYTTTSEYGVLKSGEGLQCVSYSMQVTNSTQPAALVYAMPASSGGAQQYTLYNGRYTNPTNPGTPNNYGLVNELVYPDGGWVKYTWKMSNTDPQNQYAQSAFFTGNGTMNGTPDGNAYSGACVLQYSTPVLASRTVSFDGSTIAQTQTFTYSTVVGSGYQWTSKQTSVVTTDNISESTFLTVYNYTPLYANTSSVEYVAQVAPGIPMESSVLYYSGSSTSTPVLRTVTKTWADLVTLAEEDITEGGLTSKTIYSFQAGGSPTSPFLLTTGKAEYDYGASTATQTTGIQYQSFPSNTITADGFTATIPVPSQPSVVTISNSGGTLAETDYAYDGYSLASTTGVVQHDDPNYGTALTNRGNATSVTKKCPGCTNAVTTYTYDITGQPASMTDPCGNGGGCTDILPSSATHTTYYSFKDSPSGGNAAGQSNAYLTQITYPPTGSTVHQESFQYNYVFGDLTTAQGQNSNSPPTTYQYVDPFDRLTASVLPDGGQTNIVYNDSPTSPAATTCQLINGSASAACSATVPGPTGWKTSNVLMDGMFHTKQTQLVSDPDGEDFVDITYDGLGRKRTASNPHRLASSSTDGTATTTYDVLGRPILVTEQDGSTVQTLYDQTCNTNTNTLGTIVIDEAGHQRTSCTDGLGRLVEVDEPAVSSTSTPGSGTVTLNWTSFSCTPNGYGGWIPTSGILSITVNGLQVTDSYGGSCNGSVQTLGPTIDQLATSLASYLSATGIVTAEATGCTLNSFGVCNTGNPTIQITSAAEGSNTDYTLSVSPMSGAVSLSASGATLTGGSGASTSTPFVTLYSYDALGNLLCVEQHGGVTSTSGCSSPAGSGDATNPWRPRRFTYDSLSRLTSSENPETFSYAGKISYTYDANSNLVTKTSLSPNQPTTSTQYSVTTTYTYDADNRLTKKSYVDADPGNPATPPVQYGYDGVALTNCAKAPPSVTDAYPIGRRTSMCDGSSTVPGSGSASWTHDPIGRVLTDHRFIGSVSAKVVTYVYNLDGSTSKVTAPDGKTVIYAVAGAGRPQSALDGSGDNYVKSATYAPPGELQSLTDGGVINRAYSYNSRLQPLQVFYGTNTPPTLTGSTCPSTVGNIMHRVYGFNFGSSDNGNVLSITNCVTTARSESFTYDALNRIASAESSGNQWGETYTIDAWGNLTNRGGISGKTYYEALDAAPATDLNQLTGYGYDTAGNMTTSASTTYVYDAENRLVWTTGGYRYLYDGDGNRVEKCVAGGAGTGNPCPTSGTNGTLYWMGTGSAALDESDLSGNMLEQYVFFNGTRVARRDVSTGAVHYYFSDHLGTHAVVENATGTACEQDIDYYPYGGVQNDYCSTPVAQHYKFTGKERDTESGLDNFGKRYHASSLGRFMTPDPLGIMKQKLRDPQQWNMYSYARNNPLRWIDPTGQYVCSGTKQECKAEQKEIKKDLKSKDPNVRAAAKNYGPLSKKAGDKGDNGVTVKFGEQGHGGETQFTHDKTGVVVTMNSDVVVKGASAAKNSDDDVQARAAVAHEGVHVGDYKADIASGFDAAHDITIGESEHNAYAVTNDVLRESGRSPANGVDFSTPAGIDQFLHATEPDVNLNAPISTVTEPN